MEGAWGAGGGSEVGVEGRLGWRGGWGGGRERRDELDLGLKHLLALLRYSCNGCNGCNSCNGTCSRSSRAAGSANDSSALRLSESPGGK